MTLATEIIKHQNKIIDKTRDFIEDKMNNDLWYNLGEFRLFSAEQHRTIITDMIEHARQEYETNLIREDLFYCINTMYGIYCYNS